MLFDAMLKSVHERGKKIDKVLYRADSRGLTQLEWLESYHSFSFNNYYDPARVRFGLLRVLNDDFVEPGRGFAAHPHQNMEIISIPLSGALAHKDSTGTSGVINKNDIQIMSAGSGILHSEYNFSGEQRVNFLQIWIYPHRKNIKPGYDQIKLDPADRLNKIQTAISPGKDNGSLQINQNAFLSLTRLETGNKIKYKNHIADNGLFVFMINGKIRSGEDTINKRDAIAIRDSDNIEMEANEDSDVLIIEVPLKDSR